MITFGTGGWRALIGEDFTKQNIRILSQAVANLMKATNCETHGFVIGYDRRFLSDMAAQWIAEVMAGNGIKVFFIDKVAPTPLVMFAAKYLLVHYGCAVTASHNPAAYNGVKIFTAGGKDAGEEATIDIEGYIRKVKPQKILSVDFNNGKKTGIIQAIDPFNEYIDTILETIDVESIRKRKLRVVLDPMFGVSKTCLQTILVTARCELAVINDRHDTLFGGRLPLPGAHTLNHMRNLIVEKGYDIGIGTDGDADRLGIIDEKGNFVHPNDILSLLYYYLLEYKGWKGGAVRNVATTHMLDRIAEAYGQECHEVAVGFKHVSSMMEEKNALIGGESSGGLTIRGHIKGKDGIFAAGIFLEMLSVTGMNITEMLQKLHEKFGFFYTDETDLSLDDSEKRRIFNILFNNGKVPDFGRKIDYISYRDGLKVVFRDGGWMVARFSGTEPLLRIFSEMGDETAARETINVMKDFILRHGGK